MFQNYLVFISAEKYIKCFSGFTPNDSGKSSGISEENIENITKSGSNFAPNFIDHHSLPDLNFNEHCLIKNNISIPKKSNKFMYFLQTKSKIKEVKHRSYVN